MGQVKECRKCGEKKYIRNNYFWCEDCIGFDVMRRGEKCKSKQDN